MKKLFIFLACLLCAYSYGMETDRWQAHIKKEAAKTAARFGGFDYFEHAVKEHGGPAVGKLEKVKRVMIDPCYMFVFYDRGNGVYSLNLFEKTPSGEDLDFQLPIGAIDYVKRFDCRRNYCLNFLRISSTKQNHGFGAALFLYGLHIIRQLAYDDPFFTLEWQSHPLRGDGGLSRALLNSFYEKLGGIHGSADCEGCLDLGKLCKWCEKGEKFYWRGPSLKPFELIAAQLETDKKAETCTDASSVLPKSTSTSSGEDKCFEKDEVDKKSKCE